MLPSKTIGILGGMGPQASCELYRLINQHCCGQERKLQNRDFPHLIINSLPVPDLIASEKEKKQTISMVNQGALALARAGATDIFMSCNTMHAYQDEITCGLAVRFHSLIDIVADRAQGARKVLILGSNTTMETGLYQDALNKRGIDYTIPDDSLIDKTVEMILATIAQRTTEQNLDRYIADVMAAAGRDPEIDTILLGCTELPLIFPERLGNYRVLNSLSALAEHILSIHCSSEADYTDPIKKAPATLSGSGRFLFLPFKRKSRGINSVQKA